MSRVLLVSTNIQQTPYAVYPLGMATAAGTLMAGAYQGAGRCGHAQRIDRIRGLLSVGRN